MSPQTWAALFDRAGSATTVDAVREALSSRRGAMSSRREAAGGTDAGDDAAGRGEGPPSGDRPDPSPARVVADADVLAADLLVGGDARDALDHLRAHSWTTLVASDPLLDDAAAVVAALADGDLAAAWRERVAAWREPVSHPAADHPALASAYRGGAMHLLSFDDRLRAPATGAALSGRFPVSVRSPGAFARLFDAAGLYPEVCRHDGDGDGDSDDDGDDAYPGPDRDPRE